MPPVPTCPDICGAAGCSQWPKQTTQARWALAAVAALLLVAAGVLLWAELEAPPLGTMALPPGGVPGLLKEWVGGVWARVVGAWALLVAEGRVAALALAAAAARVVPR